MSYADDYYDYYNNAYENEEGETVTAVNYALNNVSIVAIPENEPAAEPEGVGEPTGEGAWPEGEVWPEGEGAYPEGEGPHPEGEVGWPESEPEGYAEPEIPIDQPDMRHGRAAFSSLAGMLAAGIIILNIITLVAIARRPKQRKSLTYLIGLMAAFDLLGGLQFAWFSSLDMQLKLTREHYWIIVMCGIWMISMTPQITGLLHFGLHWINSLKAGVGNARISGGKIAFIVVTAIFLPFILLIPPLAGWHCIECTGSMDFDFCSKKCSNAIYPFPRIYVILMIALLLFAMALVVGIYISLGVAIKNKRNKQNGYIDAKLGDRRVFKVTCLFLGVYILFTLPVSIVLIIDYVVLNTPENQELAGRIITAFQATMFVSFISNFINPILYFTLLPSMRNALASKTPTEEVNKENGHAMNGHSNNALADEKAEEASKI